MRFQRETRCVRDFISMTYAGKHSCVLLLFLFLIACLEVNAIQKIDLLPKRVSSSQSSCQLTFVIHVTGPHGALEINTGPGD